MESYLFIVNITLVVYFSLKAIKLDQQETETSEKRSNKESSKL